MYKVTIVFANGDKSIINVSKYDLDQPSEWLWFAAENGDIFIKRDTVVMVTITK